ncbi:MAG: hpcH/HpaI aldolase/citrate lyase family protein [Hyphomicrobiales bacterium]|nr:hpcH/HpaI aldolase/citrate lyase family protein [Hyphomicrobiales bacterium]
MGQTGLAERFGASGLRCHVRRMDQDFRSLLYAPADAPLRLTRALNSGADALLLDLEDMVAFENKAQARASAATILREMQDRDGAPRLFVRVNSLDSGMIDADLDAIMPGRPHGIVLPKSRSGMDVQHLAAKLAVQEAENELPDGSTGILPLVTESGAAIFGLSTYARASHRLVALAWGVEDLAADIGAEDARNEDGGWSEPFALARHLTLFAAAAAGVPAIDTVFRDFGDLDGLRHEAQQALADGFAAKLAIHPGQVATINHVFTPTGETLARAQAIVAAFSRQAEAPFVSIEGHMFDRRQLARAQRVLARAARADQPPPA